MASGLGQLPKFLLSDRLASALCCILEESVCLWYTNVSQGMADWPGTKRLPRAFSLISLEKASVGAGLSL